MIVYTTKFFLEEMKILCALALVALAPLAGVAQNCDALTKSSKAGEDITYSTVNAPIRFFKSIESKGDSICAFTIDIEGSIATDHFEKLQVFLNGREEALLFERPIVEHKTVNGKHIYTATAIVKGTRIYELSFYQIGTIQLGFFQKIIDDDMQESLRLAVGCVYLGKYLLPK